MSRTFWRPLPDGPWEFLGAFKDGVIPKAEPFKSASILDITGLDVQQTLDAMAERFTLVDAPRSIVRNLESKQTIGLDFEQLQGYLK